LQIAEAEAARLNGITADLAERMKPSNQAWEDEEALASPESASPRGPPEASQRADKFSPLSKVLPSWLQKTSAEEQSEVAPCAALSNGSWHKHLLPCPVQNVTAWF
jgi:hypothetical protein